MIRAAVLAVLAALLLAAPASARWSTTGDGVAEADTDDLIAAVIDTPSGSFGATDVTWTSQAALDDQPSAGTVTYRVQRALGAGSFADVASGPCAGDLPRPTTSCTDTVAANGTYSYRVVATLGTWTATSNTEVVIVNVDNTNPTAAIARITTTPTNSAAPQWKVTFNESVTGVGAADFALATTGVSGASVSSVTGSGTTYTVTVNAGTGDGTIGLNLVDDDSIRDVANNPLGGTGAGNGNVTGPVDTIDRTAPSVTAMTMQDTNYNGKVNRVVITFNETLAATPPTSVFTLANVPSGGTLTSISRSGATLTLTITEGTGAASTAVGAFTIALAASATGVRDALGNQSSFAATAPTDLSRPVLLSVSDTNGTTDGLIQAADTITFTFSEPIKAASAPTAPTITEARTTGNATLAIPGVLSAATSMASTGYLNGTNRSAVFAGTTTTPGSTVVTTVGACTTGCTYPTAPAVGATMSVKPAATLTDAAGNIAATTAFSWSLVKVF